MIADWLRTLGMRRRLVLTAPRVYLRPPLDRDWRDWSLLRARSRKFLERWEPTWAEDAVSRAAYQNRLDFYRRLARRGSGLALHIFRREDDALVGGLTLNNIRRGIVQSCNVGYWIGEEYAHRGYMTEALGRDHRLCVRPTAPAPAGGGMPARKRA